MPAAAAPGVGGSQRGYSLPRAPKPNPPVRAPAAPSIGGIVSHAIGIATGSVGHAVHETTTPHSAAPASSLPSDVRRQAVSIALQNRARTKAKAAQSRQIASAVNRIVQGFLHSNNAFRASAAIGPHEEFTRFGVAQPTGSMGIDPFSRSLYQTTFDQQFKALKQDGFIPSNAPKPQLVFEQSDNAGPGGGRSWVDGDKSKIHISPLAVASTLNRIPYLGAWGKQTAIHELAHTLQRPFLGSTATVEGGAQAFADAAVPAVVGPVPNEDSTYAAYVRAARRRGDRFYMKNQFAR